MEEEKSHLLRDTWKLTWCLGKKKHQRDSLTVGVKIFTSDETELEVFVVKCRNIPKSWWPEAVTAASTKHLAKTQFRLVFMHIDWWEIP